MTYFDCYKEAAGLFSAAGIVEAEQDALLLMLDAARFTRTDWIMERGKEIPDDVKIRYKGYCARREAREPLQQILETTCFYGFDFYVTKDVLCPRQDTEHLVEWALADCKGKRVLDLCTGSGCIAVSLAKLGSAKEVCASDLSEAALLVAKENAHRNDAAITFYQSDLMKDVPGEFDVILSNPPYIPQGEAKNLAPEVTEYEPHMALFGGEDGLDFYKRIVSECYDRLTPGGVLIVEIGYDQGESVPELFRSAAFSEVTVRKDYAGLDRVVRGVKPQDGL